MNHLKRAFSCVRLWKSASGAPIILCPASRREKTNDLYNFGMHASFSSYTTSYYYTILNIFMYEYSTIPQQLFKLILFYYCYSLEADQPKTQYFTTTFYFQTDFNIKRSVVLNVIRNRVKFS